MKKKLDISGPKGNAFFILALASKLADTAGLDSDIVLEKMKSSDYNNLLRVFKDYFGELVEFVSPSEIPSVESELYTIEPDLGVYI